MGQRSAFATIAFASMSILLSLFPASVHAGAERAATAAVTASQRPVVAAIGDSYLAGIGAGRYTQTDGCRRSELSAPARLARSRGAELVDLTCPGATVLSSSRRVSSLPGRANQVFLQVGGNDIGFASLAGACFLASTATCITTVRESHRRLPEVRRGVLGLVRQIRLTAPAADVIVLGYPRILGSPAACAPLLDTERVRAVNRLQRTLDRVIRSAARTAGAIFTDWPRSVDRASLCSADPWYAMPGARLDDLLHPDSRAHRVLSTHLGTVVGR